MNSTTPTGPTIAELQDAGHLPKLEVYDEAELLLPVLHTPGRIQFRANGDANSYALLDDQGKWWLSLLLNGEQVTARQEANLRRLAACWNACEGSKTEDLEELGADYIKPLIKLIDENDARKARADWLQRMHTLHRAVEMLYVVDGYHVTICWDGTPISPDYHGETLDAAIDKAMAEFDAEARPKWVARTGEPDVIEGQLAAALALQVQLVAALKAAHSILPTGSELGKVEAALAAAGAA